MIYILRNCGFVFVIGYILASFAEVTPDFTNWSPAARGMIVLAVAMSAIVSTLHKALEVK